jgi:membrane fusion protein (multidrug efflux system)
MFSFNNKTKFMRISLLIALLGLFHIFSTSCQSKMETVSIQHLKAVEVAQQTVPIYKDFVGQVYGQADIPIRARVDGFVEKIHFNEGLKVTKGQLLYSVDDYPFRLEVTRVQSRLSEAKIMLVNAENDLGRIQPLAELNAVSKRDLDAAVARKQAAEESLKSAEASLSLAKVNLGYANIYSPITGIIGKTKAKVGEYVGKSPNPVILNTVSLIDSVIVEFFLNERDYLTWARKVTEKSPSDVKQANLPFELFLADGQLFPHLGKFRFIDREVDPKTGSILIQSIFPNPENLIRPGQFAKVRIMVNVIENALVIPQRCAFEVQGFFNVFVVNSENKVVQKQVEILDSFEDKFINRSGIEKGEKILIEGLMSVKSGQEVNLEIIPVNLQK